MSLSLTIPNLKKLRESEDRVEFKEAKNNFPWNGGKHTDQKERRKCYLGYIVALANEGGGLLIFGMKDNLPHNVVGTDFAQGLIGKMEDDVYEKLSIRIHIHELFDENNLRVIVTKIPSRPVGRTLKFEGVALMRTGDSLRNMSDEEMFNILSEQEPDFSAKICPHFNLSDIDDTAMKKLKETYAKKQQNSSFISLGTTQVLTDLNLLTTNGLTYAALILVGQEEALKRLLPNAQVNIEIRQLLNQTHFDKRETFTKALFLTIDEIWNYLNRRNSDNKIDEGPYKFDLPYFNQEVIRESVLNAIAHRDYSISSETVIKQFPDRITITNPGGFPKGVTQENLIRINSTPRCRLLTEIMEKTGLVERSGQGVDKIVRLTLSEGKPIPDYSKTDLFQVELTIRGEIEDKAFTAFISDAQAKSDTTDQLGTFDILGLHQIKEGRSEGIDTAILEKLEQLKLIKRVGGTASDKYVLSNLYFELKNGSSEIAGFRTLDIQRILRTFNEETTTAKMMDFVSIFNGDLNREQVRYLVDKLTGVILKKEGIGRGTTYSLISGLNNLNDIKSVLEQK
jgi:ATP-dependent DNA helicase RecG